MNDARRLLRALNESKFVRPDSNVQSDPGYLYHATNTENASDIAADGMIPHRPDFGTDQSCWPDGKTDKRSYFSPHANKVWMFAPEYGQAVILRVKRTAAMFKPEIGTGDIYCNKKIPSNAFKILTDDGWQSLRSAF